MTIEEDTALIVNDIVSKSDKCDCVYHERELCNRSEDHSLNEDVRDRLKLLASIASFTFHQEDSTSPYGPMMVTQDGRTSIPADLTGEQLDKLDSVVQELKLGVLKARIFDVLWLCKRKPDYAYKAIEAFTSCAKVHFDLEHWTYGADYAERALRLAAMFRKKRPELANNVADLLKSWLKEHHETDKKFVTARAIELLLEFGYESPEKLHEYAKNIAQIAENDKNFHRSESYWKLAIKAARKAENDVEANSAQAALAETYVLNAKSNTSSMSAAHWMQQAVEAYKAVQNSKERREELYKELLALQERSLEEMRAFETAIDVSECVAEAVSKIEGKSFRDAIFNFAFYITCVPDYQKLEKQAKELAQKYPLSHLFGATHLDGAGKVIAKSPSAFENSDQLPARNLYQSAALEHHVKVVGSILPAAEILRLEHLLTLDEFEALTTNNPFIFPGQERMWAQGLYAGMNGDYEIALPLIVPLLENSLRHVLKQSGVRVSTLNTHGVQEELRITAILDHEASGRIFGHNLIMDLKGLLQERTYANLRNVISHGLGTIGIYYSAPSVYLWWLCFRLVVTPYAKQLKEKPDSTK